MPIVLGYHGCDMTTAQSLLSGHSFISSTKDYDWLGSGVYFWENDPLRAFQWATQKRRHYKNPTLVGAVIELGKCFDLTTQPAVVALEAVYKEFIKTYPADGGPLPQNCNPPGVSGRDHVIRNLDCAVIRHFFNLYDKNLVGSTSLAPYVTVRGLFPEGEELYPNSGFLKKTHIQICVREQKQILGVFRLPEHQQEELNLLGRLTY